MRPIDDKLRQICRLFRIPGNLTSWEEIKVGNVNRTYKATCRRLCSMTTTVLPPSASRCW